MYQRSRRDFLKALGALSAAGCVPREDPPATPAPVVPGIDHIVMVMMENRTFDHYFGAMLLEEGRSEVDGLTPDLENFSLFGRHQPYRLETDWCTPDPPHGWNSSHRQFDEGTNGGFCAEYLLRYDGNVDPGLVMGYHNRDSLPVHYALADHYVLCDRWFASVMSSTWPNRMFSHGAQNQGIRSNDLPNGGLYDMPTIWDQLDEADLSWGYYFSDLPFAALLERMSNRDEIQGINDFYAACASGTLPAVSYVEPAFSFNDDHPPHHPLFGQMFLATVHAALAASPAWNRTLLVISYDEHGGFYDHVPPPTVPDDRADEGFDQLGFRVPALVCGPWVRGGTVLHDTLEHSSWLAEVQRRHGLEPLTLRNAEANDLSGAMDLERGQPLSPAEVPVIEMTQSEIYASCNGLRSADQPELEALLATLDNPRFLRPRSMVDVAVEQIAFAEHYGVVRIR